MMTSARSLSEMRSVRCLKRWSSWEKQLASAAGISAVMGITEPALYGVTLKLKRPVVAAALAAGIGGIVGGILQVSLYIAQNSIRLSLLLSGKKG